MQPPLHHHHGPVTHFCRFLWFCTVTLSSQQLSVLTCAVRLLDGGGPALPVELLLPPNRSAGFFSSEHRVFALSSLQFNRTLAIASRPKQSLSSSIPTFWP